MLTERENYGAKRAWRLQQMVCRMKTWRLERLPDFTMYFSKHLRRRVNGSVKPGSKPGPATVLTEAEEEHLASYLIQMADMGFGLSCETVMCLAFKIVDATQQKHPFKDQKAGRVWFDGFLRHHPKLSIHSPMPLSYCCAQCANMDTINDFFGKLGAIYRRLNLISKPIQI